MAVLIPECGLVPETAASPRSVQSMRFDRKLSTLTARHRNVGHEMNFSRSELRSLSTFIPVGLLNCFLKSIDKLEQMQQQQQPCASWLVKFADNRDVTKVDPIYRWFRSYSPIRRRLYLVTVLHQYIRHPVPPAPFRPVR